MSLLHSNRVKVLSVLFSILILVGIGLTTASAGQQDRRSSHMRGPMKAQETPASVLPPGGTTIGGPGFYDGEPGVAGVYQGPTATLCVTVSNRGSAVVNILTTPSASFDELVFAKETETRCASVENITLTCEGGSSVCAAYWRVDRLP